MNVPVRLKDIARILNLAPSTVSRALQGHPDISLQTQERVKALAAQLHYTPNVMAAGLRNQKSSYLAILIPDLSDYFYVTLLKIISRLAFEQGYRLLFFDTAGDEEKERTICHSLRKSGIAGCMAATVNATGATEHFRMLQEEGIPLVFFDRFPGNLSADRVVVDYFGGAVQAVGKIFHRGYRRIAHIAGDQRQLAFRNIQLGYKDALRKCGEKAEEDQYIAQDNNWQEQVKLWVKKKQIDAIFTAQDEQAAWVMQFLHAQGWKIPLQVGICSFGNTPIATAVWPPLTSVQADGKKMAQLLWESMQNRLQNNSTSDTSIRLLKTEWIERESLI